MMQFAVEIPSLLKTLRHHQKVSAPLLQADVKALLATRDPVHDRAWCQDLAWSKRFPRESRVMRLGGEVLRIRDMIARHEAIVARSREPYSPIYDNPVSSRRTLEAIRPTLAFKESLLAEAIERMHMK